MRKIVLALLFLLIQTSSYAQVVRTTIYPAQIVVGTQVNLTITSATAPTIPAGGVTYALIQAQGTNNTNGVCLFWRDDGTNPTITAGQALAANQSLAYSVTGFPIKLIQATGATCTATISYYRWGS